MEWHPASFFRTDIIPTTPFAILILNQPINENAFDAVRRHGTFSVMLFQQSFSKSDLCQGCSIHCNRIWRKKWIHTPRRSYSISRALDGKSLHFPRHKKPSSKWTKHNRTNKLIQTACYTLLADGGANRYYDLMKSRSLENIDVRPFPSHSIPAFSSSAV